MDKLKYTVNFSSELSQDDNALVYVASWLSLIAYYPPIEVDILLKDNLKVLSGISHVRPVSETKTDTELFIFDKPDSGESDSGIVVVAIRGSEPSSLEDWVFTDLRLSHEKAFNEAGTQRNVHSGFLDAIDSVWPEVFEELKARTNRYKLFKLFVVGHSLGGALSVLVGAKIKHLAETASDKKEKHFFQMLLESLSIHTFGAPRVGNKEFAAWFDRGLNPRCTRHSYGLDAIAHVPPRRGVDLKADYKDDWRHAGAHVHYERNGVISNQVNLLRFSDLFFKGLKNPLVIKASAFMHLPWHYYWLGEGVILGKPNMRRPLETVRYFKKFGMMAAKRISSFYVGKFKSLTGL